MTKTNTDPIETARVVVRSPGGAKYVVVGYLDGRIMKRLASHRPGTFQLHRKVSPGPHGIGRGRLLALLGQDGYIYADNN